MSSSRPYDPTVQPWHWGLLADLVALVHLGFVVFVLVGGLFVLRRPRLAWFHLPAALWGAAIELTSWPCPLTPLEKSFRALAGARIYDGGFIAHYILPVLYPPGLTRPVQLALGGVVVAVNVAVYLLVLRRRRRLRG